MLKTLRGLTLGLACLLAFAGVRPAAASVVVSIDGNVATAQILLEDAGGNFYQADATITFDSPLNLTRESLNLTAELVDPNDPGLTSRLPNLLGAQVTVDPAFPVMITVEPPATPHLFTTSFDGPRGRHGGIVIHHTYTFEVHTHDLPCSSQSLYRLFKAPIGGLFDDVTNDVLQGSMRARGRGGAFSQFLVVIDPRSALLLAPVKIVALDLRIVAAALSDLLRGDLLDYSAK